MDLPPLKLRRQATFPVSNKETDWHRKPSQRPISLRDSGTVSVPRIRRKNRRTSRAIGPTEHRRRQPRGLSSPPNRPPSHRLRPFQVQTLNVGKIPLIWTVRRALLQQQLANLPVTRPSAL